jgi:hypothetical protein
MSWLRPKASAREKSELGGILSRLRGTPASGGAEAESDRCRVAGLTHHDFPPFSSGTPSEWGRCSSSRTG